MIVGSLLVFTFIDYAGAFKLSSEVRQLKGLMDRVAAKSTELVTLTLGANASADAFIETPQTIGNKGYWLQLLNDSSKAWVEGGLGTTPFEGSDLRVYLPPETSGTGCYISDHGTIRLKCALDAGTAQIQLAGSSGGD
jgi:hypothetical protein